MQLHFTQFSIKFEQKNSNKAIMTIVTKPTNKK